MTVNILGTEYKIVKKRYDEEEAFARRSIDGFCDSFTKQIIVCDMHTYAGREHETDNTIAACEKQILRHEIVHAFLSESGLCDSSAVIEGSWAKNEEMVDWIALQGLKIYEAWKNTGAI